MGNVRNWPECGDCWSGNSDCETYTQDWRESVQADR